MATAMPAAISTAAARTGMAEPMEMADPVELSWRDSLAAAAVSSASSVASASSVPRAWLYDATSNRESRLLAKLPISSSKINISSGADNPEVMNTIGLFFMAAICLIVIVWVFYQCWKSYRPCAMLRARRCLRFGHQKVATSSFEMVASTQKNYAIEWDCDLCLRKSSEWHETIWRCETCGLDFCMACARSGGALLLDPVSQADPDTREIRRVNGQMELNGTPLSAKELNDRAPPSNSRSFLNCSCSR
mmetsp:Transcript_3980/g.9243  ORF Transcript_3980/g.9243 Transcript_3980/m.9243 type:complete len:248 (-) Transcript_3980:68-811(-)